MNKNTRYCFGDKALSGFATQKLNQEGELFYKGAFYLFGSKIPIYLSLEPTDKTAKGEKVYNIFTHLLPVPIDKSKRFLEIPLRSASRQRLQAIKKLQEICQKLGVVYEYHQINKEREEKKKCKACKRELAKEWRTRLQAAVGSNVERQREIRKRQVQKLLARRKKY